MWKRAIVAMIVAVVGYGVYEHYTGPFVDAPALDEGDFLLAFGGDVGLKGVMRGIDDDPTRKYISFGGDNVPSWYRDTWSICRKPTAGEASAFLRQVNTGPGGRIDAVCEIDADGDVFVRGWVISVPDL